MQGMVSVQLMIGQKCRSRVKTGPTAPHSGAWIRPQSRSPTWVRAVTMMIDAQKLPGGGRSLTFLVGMSNPSPVFVLDRTMGSMGWMRCKRAYPREGWE